MKYSEGFKSQAVAKVLDNHGRSINEVAEELNVYPATLSNWIKQAKEGKLGLIEGDAIPPSQRHLGEKLSLLLESKTLAPEQLGEWLRTHGLHSEHIPLWEQELGDFMKTKNTDLKSENSNLKRENKELQKELARKEKALAEAAVLLTLKKKYQNLFTEDEES
jgi:transposase-like protein